MLKVNVKQNINFLINKEEGTGLRDLNDPIVTEIFNRGSKLNIFFFFITQSYFALLKIIRLNFTQYFIMKIPCKKNFKKLHMTI